MTEADLIEVSTQTIWAIIKCSLPLLLVSLIVGLIISIFQTVTSIQEQTLTFVPKLLAIFITLLLTGNWIMQSCVEFFNTLCDKIQQKNCKHFIQYYMLLGVRLHESGRRHCGARMNCMITMLEFLLKEKQGK